MLITTRFGDTNQLHHVTQPGGDRTQLTLFPDRVDGGSYEPTKGEYFVFSKGAGGNEFNQNYADEGHGFAKKKNADYQFYSTVQFIRETLLR